ncbi:hypothetical protein SAMN04488588_1833 [Geotoga petraea]|uniref:Uncharacterized protein n=2 Tax=Geotoga petraea TaxID=28234 RepID=A0A1G6PJB9_9BACT|nr:hypothetical protein [Geotoga petraea]SDC80342.1 hypothetical protein SAMN04488588_1833 [Geotoga petraea]
MIRRQYLCVCEGLQEEKYIKRANKIKEQKLQEDKKEIHGYEYYPNPYLNIQTFISELLKISTK